MAAVRSFKFTSGDLKEVNICTYGNYAYKISHS